MRGRRGLVATVIGLYLIDTFGRKRLMEVGMGMMCAFAFCIAISYAIQSALLTFVFVMRSPHRSRSPWDRFPGL